MTRIFLYILLSCVQVCSVKCCSSVLPLCLKCSVLAAVSLRPRPLNTQSALIGQLTRN